METFYGIRKFKTMKKFKLKSKMASVLLSIIMLMQSCSVYKSSSLDNAVQENTKTKVFTTTGISFKFNKVINKDNGKYVGLKKKNGEIKEIEINDMLIKEVKVKDKTASIIGTVVLALSVIGLTYLIIDGIGIGKINWSQVGDN